MPEIGVTLREARMRAGIDIAEVESRTKIRAKYLRALENEEWSLLPGTTFVKSFLRTYAEALGLDAKLLVEEYKFRHEPYEVGGAQNGGQRGRKGGGRRAGGGAFGPQKRTNLIPILVLLIVVAGAIYAVLELSKNEKDPAPPVATTTRTQEPQRASDQASAARKEARRKKRLVLLRVVAPGNESASVCAKDASGKTVLDEPELAPGRRTKQVTSKEFRLVTTGGAKVYDGNRRLTKVKADDKNVIAYTITKRSARRLTGSGKPSCSS
jgi:cytoskeleton protein RodZ